MANRVITPALPRIYDGEAQILHREIGQIPFADNQKRKFDIKEQPNQIKNFLLHCTVNVTTVTVSVPIRPDAPFSLLRNIKVRSSQSITLKDAPGIAFDLLNRYEYGTVAHNTIPANLDAGDHEFVFDIIIPFDDVMNLLPERTILNSMQYQDLVIEIWWANFWASITSAQTVAGDVINSFTCDLIAVEREPIIKVNQKKEIIYNDESINRQQMIDTFVTKGAAPETNFLMPENTFIKTLMAITRDDQGDRAEGIIETFQVDYDSKKDIIRNLPATAIQSQNKQYYHVENLPTGVYIIEFDLARDFKSLFKTKGRNYAYLRAYQFVTPVAGSVDLFRRRIATPAQITP